MSSRPSGSQYINLHFGSQPRSTNLSRTLLVIGESFQSSDYSGGLTSTGKGGDGGLAARSQARLFPEGALASLDLGSIRGSLDLTVARVGFEDSRKTKE